MRHPEYARLNDYVDGRLDPAWKADVEAHIAVCDACRGRVGAIRSLEARLGSLPAGIRPRRDLRPPAPESATPSIWSELAGAVRHGPWLRAAAVVVGLVGAGLGLWLGGGPEGSGPGASVDGIPSPVAASYAVAGDELAAVLRVRRVELNPAAARSLESSLAAVDAAIRELEEAGATGPDTEELARQLEARQRTRLELLRGALDLLEGS